MHALFTQRVRAAADTYMTLRVARAMGNKKKGQEIIWPPAMTKSRPVVEHTVCLGINISAATFMLRQKKSR